MKCRRRMIDDRRYCELFVSTHRELGFKRMRMEP
jgi:hypothetical protein